MSESNFIRFWREAETASKSRRWPLIPMGRAHLYWLMGFTAEQAAEAETFRRFVAPRKVH